MKPSAILSVFDKSQLDTFASGLAERGVELYSTGGTLSFLEKQGIPVTSISDYTGSPEIMDGRVKTLHPAVHGGILARRDNPQDIETLKEQNFAAFDYVIVNLYPFLEKVKEVEASGESKTPSLIEVIDIGGPTMLRAAAKNCHHVVPVCDPADYQRILEAIDQGGVGLELRQELASKVFRLTAHYDAEVARYFSLNEELKEEDGSPVELAPVEAVVLEREQELRYGENPHQAANLYSPFKGYGLKSKKLWKQRGGKDLSFNNLVDMQATLELFLELRSGLSSEERVAVVIKHTNPCGAAVASTSLDAFKAAKSCDPVSAFGGIIAVSGTVDKALAEEITSQFVELVCVGEIDDEAREVFAKKKNLRLIECDFDGLWQEVSSSSSTFKSLGGDFLLQSSDNQCRTIAESDFKVGSVEDSTQLRDMNLAWKLAKHVKSNAIVLVKDGKAIGVGAGQMSRLDSAKIALSRSEVHGFDAKGAIAASDAFLPFPDTLEILAEGGITSLVQPGGSVKDDVVVEAAKKLGVSMAFTGQRHFRH